MTLVTPKYKYIRIKWSFASTIIFYLKRSRNFSVLVCRTYLEISIYLDHVLRYILQGLNNRTFTSFKTIIFLSYFYSLSKWSGEMFSVDVCHEHIFFFSFEFVSRKQSSTVKNDIVLSFWNTEIKLIKSHI